MLLMLSTKVRNYCTVFWVWTQYIPYTIQGFTSAAWIQGSCKLPCWSKPHPLIAIVQKLSIQARVIQRRASLVGTIFPHPRFTLLAVQNLYTMWLAVYGTLINLYESPHMDNIPPLVGIEMWLLRSPTRVCMVRLRFYIGLFCSELGHISLYLTSNELEPKWFCQQFLRCLCYWLLTLILWSLVYESLRNTILLVVSTILYYSSLHLSTGTTLSGKS